MAPWKLRRSAARVILLNADDQVFLINAVDPNDPSKPEWWEIPGGGIDPGEASAACAARELWEEGGFTDVQVGPVAFTQYVEFSFGGYDFEQDEVIHVARTTETEIREPQGLEFLEALAFRGSRWWDLDEVERADVGFLPPRLPELLRSVVEGTFADPPLDISPD